MSLREAAERLLERWTSQQDMDNYAGAALFEDLRAALAEAPKAEPVALSDEAIIALMPPRLREWHDYGPIQRATLMDFARAVLAHGRKG